jgi:hypothetical protein
MSVRTEMLKRINANRVKSGEKPIKVPCCNSAVPGLHSSKCPTWGKKPKGK